MVGARSVRKTLIYTELLLCLRHCTRAGLPGKKESDKVPAILGTSERERQTI